TISTGREDILPSARIVLSSSRPSMFGMFQSEITKPKPPACSLFRASTPSSASSTLLKPSSFSRLRTIRRMVEKSSTTKNLSSLSAIKNYSSLNTYCLSGTDFRQHLLANLAKIDHFAHATHIDGLA